MSADYSIARTVLLASPQAVGTMLAIYIPAVPGCVWKSPAWAQAAWWSPRGSRAQRHRQKRLVGEVGLQAQLNSTQLEPYYGVVSTCDGVELRLSLRTVTRRHLAIAFWILGEFRVSLAGDNAEQPG